MGSKLSRWVGAAIVGFGAVFGVGMATAVPASAASFSCPSDWQADTWQNTANLNYLNVSGSGGSGAKVITWYSSSASPHTNEEWCLQRASEGGWYFHPKYNTGLCMDVQGANYSSGTGIIVWTCNGRANQRFAVTVPPGQHNHVFCPTAHQSLCVSQDGADYGNQVILRGASYDNHSFWF
jgi:hypothetical protein